MITFALSSVHERLKFKGSKKNLRSSSSCSQILHRLHTKKWITADQNFLVLSQISIEVFWSS